MKIIHFFAVLCLVGLAVAEKARFDNYQVWSLEISNDEQLKVLQEVELKPDGYQLWGSPTNVGKHIEVVVPPHKIGDFTDMVKDYSFKNKLVNKNLQSLIDNEQPKVKSPRFGWTEYHTLDEIYEYLRETVKNHPDVARGISMGTSWEGRPIEGIHINYGKNKANTTIFIESNIHAREWITSATTTHFIESLLHSQNEQVRFAAENYEWYIFPVVNPDGYVYTHETNRMWRKTRSKRPGSSCYGTDGNRNFKYSWMQGGASQDPCSDTYAGPEPFSELETTAISNFFETIKHKVEMYLSFHSYSQLLMYPFAHNQDPINNKDDHIALANVGAAQIASMYGTKYTAGNAQTVLYTTSGGSRDWAKGHHNVPFSFTYEMRDTGYYGFLLPADQIIKNAFEIEHSVFAMMEEGRKRGYFRIEN
ncbi:zinc carboxypeptidase-like [Culicoides brevitarsis]|uniref:zinc carboxypeptidase-like n=1 Tax=Culicoides brevitarsis TaxID=469753 RepID=UPI00307B3119